VPGRIRLFSPVSGPNTRSICVLRRHRRRGCAPDVVSTRAVETLVLNLERTHVALGFRTCWTWFTALVGRQRFTVRINALLAHWAHSEVRITRY